MFYKYWTYITYNIFHATLLNTLERNFPLSRFHTILKIEGHCRRRELHHGIHFQSATLEKWAISNHWNIESGIFSIDSQKYFESVLFKHLKTSKKISNLCTFSNAVDCLRLWEEVRIKNDLNNDQNKWFFILLVSFVERSICTFFSTFSIFHRSKWR